MPYKTCPDCRQISYSAAYEPLWYCPCCGRDLSREHAIHDRRQLLLAPKKAGGVLLQLKRRTV